MTNVEYACLIPRYCRMDVFEDQITGNEGDRRWVRYAKSPHAMYLGAFQLREVEIISVEAPLDEERMASLSREQLVDEMFERERRMTEALQKKFWEKEWHPCRRVQRHDIEMLNDSSIAFHWAGTEHFIHEGGTGI